MPMSSEIAATIEEMEEEERRTSLSVATPNESTNVTLHQRMLSACSGSLITSLVVTPFDVVRIRLQQQQILLPDHIKSSDGCCQQVFWQENNSRNTLKEKRSAPLHAESSLKPGSAIVDEFCSTSNACAQDSKIKGTFSGISKIRSTEGFLALYRGLSLVLLMAIPSNVVYFSGYEYLRDASPIKDNQVLNPLLCGSLARVLSATSVAPIELIKTRLQAIPSTSGSNLMKLVLKNSYKEIKDTGLSSIFRGLPLTLLRDVPFSGIYWSSYEYISTRLRKHIPYLNPNINASHSATMDTKVFLSSFISGSISGVIAAVLTNPFDVGKTRLQVSSEHLRTPMFKFLYQMIKNEGIGSLYVGLVPRSMKIAPSCAIMISTYELGKRFF